MELITGRNVTVASGRFTTFMQVGRGPWLAYLTRCGSSTPGPSNLISLFCRVSARLTDPELRHHSWQVIKAALSLPIYGIVGLYGWWTIP